MINILYICSVMLLKHKDIVRIVHKRIKEDKPHLYAQLKESDTHQLIHNYNKTIDKILRRGGFITLHTHWCGNNTRYIRILPREADIISKKANIRRLTLMFNKLPEWWKETSKNF